MPNCGNDDISQSSPPRILEKLGAKHPDRSVLVNDLFLKLLPYAGQSLDKEFVWNLVGAAQSQNSAIVARQLCRSMLVIAKPRAKDRTPVLIGILDKHGKYCGGKRHSVRRVDPYIPSHPVGIDF